MLRIVGVQRSGEPETEFVLLQNQGIFRVCLRGHLVADEDAFLDGGRMDWDRTFAFGDDVSIPPKAYVMLVTGYGDDGWGKSKDGSQVYYKFWQRGEVVWSLSNRPLHVLGVLHSKVVRPSPQLAAQ